MVLNPLLVMMRAVQLGKHSNIDTLLAPAFAT